MFSTSAEWSALSTTTLVDFYARHAEPGELVNSQQAVRMGRLFAMVWEFCRERVSSRTS
jgi:hypothetical protein